MAGNGGVNGSILQYGGGGLVKKPVMVGKGAVGDDVVEWEGMVGYRANLAGLERRSFLDGYTNRN